MIVDGIGKAALHDVLPTLAHGPSGRAVGLRARRCHQRRLHMPSNRAPPLGMGTLLPPRTVSARRGILNQIDRELLLRPVLMPH